MPTGAARELVVGREDDVEVLPVELGAVLGVLRRRWLLVAVSVAAFVALALAHALTAAPRYEATTTVFFSLERGETVGELVQGSTYTQNLVQSYAEVATMPVVLDPVIASLDLQATSESLGEEITAEAPLGTVLLEITVEQDSPELAATVADAVATSLARAVGDLSPGAARSGSITVTTIAPAVAPTGPSSPQPLLNAAVALLAGLVAGVGLALVLEALTARVDSREAVARITSAPVIATVPRDPRARQRPLPASTHPHDPRAESYRGLRTNLHFLRTGSGPQTLVVTSSLPAEGKTTIAANLAVTMADAGASVLLVDADLRRPAVADLLGLEGAVGLSTVLAGRAHLDDVTQPWTSPNLHVLTAGAVPPNPSELLASPAMSRLLELARARYDTVVIDCAPTLPVTDATILAARTDGAVVVVDARRTQRRQVAETLTRLTTAGVTVLGVALNGTAGDIHHYYGPAERALA